MSGLTVAIGGPGNRWEAGLARDRISTLSRESVPFPVNAWNQGLPYDPRAHTVRFAFLEDRDGAPESADWKTGSWDVNLVGGYVALCNIGPGGVVQLAAGEWFAWIEIDATATLGDLIVRQIGRLIVE